MVLMAIDPHFRKYAYAIFENGVLRRVDTVGSVVELLAELKLSDYVVCEAQYVKRGQKGKSQILNLAIARGKVEGLCEVFNKSFTPVLPSTWKTWAFEYYSGGKRRPIDVAKQKKQASGLTKKADELDAVSLGVWFLKTRIYKR